MQFHYQSNPLATQIILTKEDIDTLRQSIQTERDQEDQFALMYYGIPYEYEETVEEEVRSAMHHLKGVHHGTCVRQPEECRKCTAENHLGVTTLKNFNQTAQWHLKKALDDNKGDILQSLAYLEALSQSWSGIKQAIQMCKDHIKLLQTD